MLFTWVQAARYESRHRDIMEAALTVFADAAEEFATINAVKQQLEEWKARWGPVLWARLAARPLT